MGHAIATPDPDLEQSNLYAVSVLLQESSRRGNFKSFGTQPLESRCCSPGSQQCRSGKNLQRLERKKGH